MPTQTREQWLDEYLESLTKWAMSSSLSLWRRVDRARIRESYYALLPGLLGVHERLVVEALEAVDLYMTLVAADEGWMFIPDWEAEYPNRPQLTYRGEDASIAYLRAPLIVLNRIKRGMSIDDAMLSGWGYVAGIVGTEAHEIARNVTADRVAA